MKKALDNLVKLLPKRTIDFSQSSEDRLRYYRENSPYKEMDALSRAACILHEDPRLIIPDPQKLLDTISSKWTQKSEQIGE